MTERVDSLGRTYGRDYTGLTIGVLLVLERAEPSRRAGNRKRARWRVQCSVCGTVRVLRTDRLGSGVRGCHCKNAAYVRPIGRHNLRGLVVGDLEVIEPAWNVHSNSRTAPRMGYTAWKCDCRACGRTCSVKTKQLVAQKFPATHCGCRRMKPDAPVSKKPTNGNGKRDYEVVWDGSVDPRYRAPDRALPALTAQQRLDGWHHSQLGITRRIGGDEDDEAGGVLFDGDPFFNEFTTRRPHEHHRRRQPAHS